MFLVKIKLFGWLLAGFVLLASVAIGYGIFRATAKNAVAAATAPPAFSKVAAFRHMPATDPAVATALSADNMTAGKSLVGKSVVMLGHITKVYVPAGNLVYLINFAQKYRNAFTMVIDAKDYGTFPDPNALIGKQVLVRGTPFLFKDQPEIQLNSLDQLAIVDGTKAKR